MKKIGFLFLGIFFTASFLAVFFVWNKNQNKSVNYFLSGNQDRHFFDEAYTLAKDRSCKNTHSIISAHHLLIANKIAELFHCVSSNEIKTVFLLSPNHFDAGKNSIQITDGIWKTPYGNLSTDSKIVHELQKEKLATLEIQTFENEHGISGLTPFIKRSFPNAKFVPIVIHESARKEEVEKLGSYIALKYPNAFVVASVDMSHYLPEYISNFHDEITLNAIENGKNEKGNLEVDANRVLQILLKINEIKGEQSFHLTHHGSSLQMGIARKNEENTSHILGYFQKGKSKEDESISFHVLGDIMLDRNVRKKIEETNDVSYPWKKMQRFLMGVDFVVANLEGTVGDGPSMNPHLPPYNFIFDPKSIVEMKKYVDVVSLANNHLDDRGKSGQEETRERLNKIGIEWFSGFDSASPVKFFEIKGKKLALIGYHQFFPNIESVKTEIQKAKDQNAFTVVYPHWGEEYQFFPDETQKDLAKKFVEFGADFIIGGHPHVAQGIDLIENKPVVWSLGNFIFDQPMSETWNALTVGVILEKDEIQLHLLPVFTKDGQPKPFSDSDAKAFFQTISSYSGENVKDEIKTGVLRVKFE